MRKISTIFILLLVIAAGIGGYLLVHKHQADLKKHGAASADTNGNAASVFNKQQYSIDDPNSIWVVVNKKRPLNPKAYVPTIVVPTIPLRLASGNEEMHVRADMAKPLEQMVAAAKSEAGLSLMLASGYRSYNFQVNLYNTYVKQQGQNVADTQSARAGYSEHQTGLAADLEPASRTCEVETCFANTPEGKWLAANAYRFGFVIRYPENQQNITGYIYEPWHVRYVGTALATEMHNEHIGTLEAFFGLPAAPTY